MNDAQTDSIQQNQETSNNNQSQQPMSVQNLEQLQASGVKLTAEQEEEIKLRIKYPNPQKPGGSAFIQKMLHKGSKKYFDSGDYNMAKSKIKSLNGSNTKATIPNSGIVGQTPTSPNGVQQQEQQQQQQQAGSNEFNSPTIVLVDAQSTSSLPITLSSSITTTPNTTTHNEYSTNNQQQQQQYQASSNQIKTPIIINNTQSSINHQTPLINYSTSSNSISPLSSSSILNTNTTTNSNYYLNTNHQMSNSLSTQSIHSMLSSSLSSDKLSNIQINTTNPSCILDSEEIGHGIPTPECLPQSRKHSIVQSKLATPRLSSS